MKKRDYKYYNFEAIYEEYKNFEFNSSIDHQSKAEKIEKLTKMITPHLENNKTKNILILFALILTGSLNAKGEIEDLDYTAWNRNFLMKFLLSIFEKDYAFILLRIIEKRICKPP